MVHTRKRPDRCLNGDGAKGSSSHNNSYHQNTESGNNTISKIALRRCAGSDEFLLAVDRGGETIIVAANIRELKSELRFRVVTANQQTRIFLRDEWKAIRARAEGFAS
jgi:hypothetical protein